MPVISVMALTNEIIKSGPKFASDTIGLVDSVWSKFQPVKISIENCFDKTIKVNLSRRKDFKWFPIEPNKTITFEFNIQKIGTVICSCDVKYNGKIKQLPVYGDGAPRRLELFYALYRTQVKENHTKLFDWDGWPTESLNKSEEILILTIPKNPKTGCCPSFCSTCSLLKLLASFKSIFKKPVPLENPLDHPLEISALKSLEFEANSKSSHVKIFGKHTLRFLNKDGSTLLHIYAKNGNLEAAKELIEKYYFPVNVSDYFHQQPIHVAAEKGHYDVLEFLLKNGASVKALANYELDKENTYPSVSPLHYASYNNHASCIRLLLDNKANINHQDEYGWTSLHWACYNGNFELVKLLLKNKANINVVNENYTTPLHFACYYGYLDVVKLLAENDAKIDAVDKYGFTPLHIACKREHIEIVKFLISKDPFLINAKNEDEHTPFHCACIGGNVEVAKFLMEKGAEIYTSDKDGDTPLHISCEIGNLDIVKFLLENSPNIESIVNSVNEKGWTPLHWACCGGHLEVAKLLLENGAKIDVKNGDGKTPWDVAVKEKVENKLEELKHELIL